MYLYTRKIFFYFSIRLLLLGVLVFPAEMVAQSNLTVDELYEKARQVAFEDGDYEQARKIAYRALERSPDYHGIRIFVGRLYAWDGKYAKAREELQYVLEKDPDNRRALSAIIDVESWSGQYHNALEWSNKALAYYPQDEEFMMDKASAQHSLENYDAAKQTYRAIIDIHSSQDARKALQSLRLEQMKYSASISYRHDRFGDIFDPWNFWEFQLSRQTPYGSIIGRVQHANRFSTNGVQFNIDAYPSLFEGMYAYVSGGYSQSSIYPRFRFGFSLYKSLPKAFELEGGIRYLEFSTSQTTIYTMSLTKYWGNYLFTARTYFVPSSAGSSQSLSLLARRYFGDARTYVGINGGYGSASTEIQFAEDIRRLDSWSVGIAGQYPISERVTAGGSASFNSEQFINYQRDQFSFKASLSYRF